MSSFSVDITPDKTLFSKLGSVGYRTEQALAELLDNSIDARISNTQEKIKVILNFEETWIGVSDDGTGMNKEEFVNAMTIARGSKTDDKLGKFGMGMKSACASLGEKILITTSKINSKKEYKIKYDEDSWLRDKSQTWTNFTVEEKLLDKKNNWHGTKIIISKLKIPIYPNQISKFKENFGIRYSPYLESAQISIQINTITCIPKELDIVKDSKINLSIPLESNHEIHGFVALLKKRSIKGHYGIHLFKNNRLIKAFEKFGFSTHPEYAKIIGELHLDHVPVNFSKSDFISQSLEYEESKKAFMNSKTVKQIISSSISKDESSSTIESIFNYFAGNSNAESLTKKMRTKTAKELIENYESFEIKIENTPVLFTFEASESESLYVIHPTSHKISVIINKNNPTFEYVTNPLFLIGVIATEIKLVISEPNYQTFLEKRNSGLSKFLNDWAQKTKTPSSRLRETPIPQIRNYGLSADLGNVYEYLDEHYEFKFQFTALSTLSSFLHNFLKTKMYTIHTLPGKGEYLIQVINKTFEDKFFILNSPTESVLSQTLKISKNKNIIIIREYAEIKGSFIASPEKAWVDLLNEIHTHKIPLSKQELTRIYSTIKRQMPIDENEIKRYAKHLKKLHILNSVLDENVI